MLALIITNNLTEPLLMSHYKELVKVTLLMLLEIFCKVNVLFLLPLVKQLVMLEV